MPINHYQQAAEPARDHFEWSIDLPLGTSETLREMRHVIAMADEGGVPDDATMNVTYSNTVRIWFRWTREVNP